jgi:hypothetical protein
MPGMMKKAVVKPTPKPKVTPKAKATPTAKPKQTPTLTWQQRQKKAEADLLKKRQAEARRTGSWPNGYTN